MKNSIVLSATLLILLTVFTSCEKENKAEMLSPCFGVEVENFKLLTSLDIEKNYQYTSFFQSDRYLIAKASTYPPDTYYFIIYDKISHEVSEIEIPGYIGNTTILGNKIYFAYESSILSYVDLNSKTIHYTDINISKTWGTILQLQVYENNLGILFFDHNSGYYYNFLYDIQTNQMTPLFTANKIKGVKIGFESSTYTKLYRNYAQQTCLLFLFEGNSSIDSYVFSINTETGQEEYFQNVGYLNFYNTNRKPSISNNHFLLLYNYESRKIFNIQTGEISNIEWVSGFGDYIFTKSGEILEGSSLTPIKTYPVYPDYTIEILAFLKDNNKILMKINDRVSLIDLQTKCMVKHLTDKSFEIIPDVNNMSLYYWGRIQSLKNVIQKYEY